MRKNLIFLTLVWLIVSTSFGIKIYIKELSYKSDFSIFEKQTNRKLSDFNINIDQGAIYWVKYGKKDYIVWNPLIKNVYKNNIEDVKNALYGPYMIWDVETKRKIISPKIVQSVVAYTLFELTPDISSFSFKRLSNYSAWNFWKDYFEKYVNAYSKIRDEVIGTNKILAFLDITDFGLSTMLSILLGGPGILGGINTTIEFGDIILTYNEMKKLYEDINSLSLKIAEDYINCMVQNNNDNNEKCETPLGIESDLTNFLGNLEIAHNISQASMEAYKRIISIKITNDLTLAFGNKWIKDALRSNSKGFLTQKLKEAKQIIKSKAFEKSLISLMASFLKTDTRGAVKEGIRIALNSNAIVTIGRYNLQLLDKIAAHRNINIDAFDNSLILEFLTNVIVFEYVKSYTINEILEYGKPSKINLIQRILAGVSAMFKNKKIIEGLKGEIELSRNEAILLMKNLGGREYFKEHLYVKTDEIKKLAVTLDRITLIPLNGAVMDFYYNLPFYGPYHLGTSVFNNGKWSTSGFATGEFAILSFAIPKSYDYKWIDSNVAGPWRYLIVYIRFNDGLFFKIISNPTPGRFYKFRIEGLYIIGEGGVYLTNDYIPENKAKLMSVIQASIIPPTEEY